MKRHMYTSVFALVALLVFCGNAYSQEKPQWTKGYFTDEANSYIEVVSATGTDEESARNKAASVAIERRSLSTGKRVQVTVRNNVVQVSGDDALTVKARIIDEYIERYGANEYRVYLLLQTAKNPTFDFEPVRVTEKYGFSPRVFVPGMAQLHKGNTGKGVLFIVGQVATIGGIVAAEGLRASNESKINSTHNATDRQTYINNVDNMQNIRNGFIAGAVAIYAWNVIDGIVANGKKHVVVGDLDLRLTPYITPQSGGVVLSLNF